MAVYNVFGIPYSDELYHFGIKGQKWGVRRFQNADGTRTAEGKKRYNNGDTRKKEKEEKRAYRKSLIEDAKNVHKMSDGELLAKIGRLQKEKQLMELTYERLTSSADPKKNMMINAGKKVAATALAGIAAYGGAAILSGEFNPKSLASYMFPNPNKKK